MTKNISGKKKTCKYVLPNVYNEGLMNLLKNVNLKLLQKEKKQ